jgi:cytochrome c peroxidase
MPDHRPKTILLVALLALTAGCQDDRVAAPDTERPGSEYALLTPLSPRAELGRLLFEDENLSVRRNQACQTCHEPSQGGAAPLLGIPSRGSVVEGSVEGRFGNRKPPTTAYATLTPNFSGGTNPTGGIFWDGRATGAVLGNPAADQALGPFVNPAEQALPDIACAAYRVLTGAYSANYTDVWGDPGITFPADAETVCTNEDLPVGEHLDLSLAERDAAQVVYYNVGRSIQAFEAAQNTFSSRLDAGSLTALEDQGRRLFSGKGKCHQCHTSKGARALFTDFKFHNLGVPKNPFNPVYDYGTSAFDPGLGGFTGSARHLGKFRTPTVRNAGAGDNRTYMHNGVFVSLLQVVDFYNSRDVTRACSVAERLDPTRYGNLVAGALGCWPPAEYPGNMDTKQMGNLGLTRVEVESIVAYMMAMTDQ